MDTNTELILSGLYNVTLENTSTTTNITNNTTNNNSSSSNGAGIVPPTGNFPPATDILNTYSQYRLSVSLVLYVLPILLIFGTIGNGLSFAVMCRRSMTHLSTCFYLAMMAVADTMVLFFSGLRRWIFILQNKDLMNLSSAACKIFNFLTYFSFQFSAWLLVAVTIERFIGIHFPLKAPSFTTVKRAKKVTVLLSVIFLLINCHFFWTVDLPEDEQYCMPTDYYKDFHDSIVPWVDAILYSFLPFVIIIILNILIICDNRRAVKFRASVRRSSQQIGSRALEHHQKLTIMLLSVSFMFLVTSSPKAILFTMRFNYFEFEGNTVDFQLIATYLLVSRITDLFIHLTHTMNFLLYCITGQRFRQELKNLLKCKNFKQRRISAVSSSVYNLQRTAHRPSETSLTDVDELSIGNI